MYNKEHIHPCYIVETDLYYIGMCKGCKWQGEKRYYRYMTTQDILEHQEKHKPLYDLRKKDKVKEL